MSQNRRQFLSALGVTGAVGAIAAVTRLAGRLGTIEDIVPLVEFLASPQSRWVNAQTIFINGGYVTR
jgi:NAD(P)-dependent dehydrogenase (short-subunit alcohol dehydrogenase family)